MFECDNCGSMVDSFDCTDDETGLAFCRDCVIDSLASSAVEDFLVSY